MDISLPGPVENVVFAIPPMDVAQHLKTNAATMARRDMGKRCAGLGFIVITL